MTKQEEEGIHDGRRDVEDRYRLDRDTSRESKTGTTEDIKSLMPCIGFKFHDEESRRFISRDVVDVVEKKSIKTSSENTQTMPLRMMSGVGLSAQGFL